LINVLVHLTAVLVMLRSGHARMGICAMSFPARVRKGFAGSFSGDEYGRKISPSAYPDTLIIYPKRRKVNEDIGDNIPEGRCA
jgi:hypothetical protein